MYLSIIIGPTQSVEYDNKRGFYTGLVVRGALVVSARDYQSTCSGFNLHLLANSAMMSTLVHFTLSVGR